MLKLLVAFTLSAVTIALPQGPAREPSVFAGWRGCLAIPPDTTIHDADVLTLVARDRSPMVLRGGAPSANQSSGCTTVFRELQTSREAVTIGRVQAIALDENWRQEPLFAVRTGPGVVVEGGVRTKLSSAASRAAFDRVPAATLNTGRAVSDLLIQAYRFGATGSVVELYVGDPSGPADIRPRLTSVRIWRVFLVNGSVAGTERFERVSGREERVDTAAPMLTVDNWSESDTAWTVAFLSEDGGASWQRLWVDSGFEGIWWIVQSLRPGLPRTFERYLYIPH